MFSSFAFSDHKTKVAELFLYRNTPEHKLPLCAHELPEISYSSSMKYILDAKS